MNYKYPCTGNITVNGFGQYLEDNIAQPRKNILEFSKELQSKYNIPYLSLVNSGSSANLVAAFAMAEKLKQAGKPLIAAISAFTFPTTVSALIVAGFEIKIIDTIPNGFTMSPDKLEADISEVSLIVPTHFLGFPADMRRIREIAKRNDCLILQDACETLYLLDSDQRPYFEYGDMITWSFYHPHHLSAYGGGAVLSLNQEDAMLVDSIIHWGRSCKCHIDKTLCTVHEGPAHQFTYERIGFNVEISELNACFGRWMFQSFDSQENHRKENYRILFEILNHNSNFEVYPHPEIGGSLFVFPIRLKNGMTVTDAYNRLKPSGVEIRTLMGGVCNEQKAFCDIGSSILENAHDMALHTFFVGIHQTLSHEMVREMGQIINEALG